MTFNESGSKYLRKILGAINGMVDVYAVLLTFNVRCPARQHAVKKLLCSGLRGKGGARQDLLEARDAVERAIQLQTKEGATPPVQQVPPPPDQYPFGSPLRDKLALDVDTGGTARALHRVVRAMHDGHCPSCGCIADATVFRRPEGPKEYQCPACEFHITCDETRRALAEFQPFLQKSVDVFLQWRKQND